MAEKMQMFLEVPTHEAYSRSNFPSQTVVGEHACRLSRLRRIHRLRAIISPAVSHEWPQDLTHVTPIAPKATARRSEVGV
jgi:hypothetical protein